MRDGYILDMKNISKRFENSKDVVNLFDGFDLKIKKGELIALLGPSGCGKSTLLEMIAGFDLDYDGEIFFKGEEITGTSGDRTIIFQKDALFPWLNVFENIAYGLKVKKLSKNEIHEKVMDAIERVNLLKYEHYYPDQLSGGMKQRVALARVLVLHPEMILMDEPFGALDSFTRLNMQELLMKIRKDYSPSIVFITHDIDEAILLADRVILLDSGNKDSCPEIMPVFVKDYESVYEKTMDVKFNEYKSEILEYFHLGG